ncbi:hypothetical protein CN912_31000, partial [Bacillus cereus]
KDIAESTQEYMEQNLVDIIESVNPPTTGLKPNKTLWRDISNGKPGVLKIWTGTAWEPVVPDTGPLQQSIKDVKKDIETAKTELNQKVQEAQNQATGQFNEVKESLQGVSRTISSIENKQGEIDKKVTQVEQDSNGFKTSIESLTKKDTEISNKLNTVEQTVEGTKKTISDVQQTTSELKKTTEIKEEAGRTKERMEQINSKVESIDVGVSNLVINSSCDNEKPRMFDQPGESQVGGVDDIRYYEKHLAIKCNRYTDAFYQIGGYEKSLHGLEPGKEVTISADINCESVDYYFEMFYATNAEGNNWRAFVGELYKELKIWKRRSFTFKIPNDTTSIMFRIYFERVVTSNGTWLNFKNVQIERGNIATGYKRAYQDQVTSDEFTKKTTEIEKSVDGVKTTVSTVQKDQGTMQTTLNQVKQTTDSNSQTITTLSQTQGKQGEIIQQNTSDITQLNNQIKSKVTDTQMQEYVGGLGSTNLLFNAAFEDRVINASTGVVTSKTPSITKWSLAGTGSGITIVPESVRHHEGYNSVKITATGQTASKWSGIMQRVPAVQNSGDYVFSAWVYVQDKNTLDNGGAIKLQFFNGANAVSTFAQTEFKDLLVNNSWVLVSVRITSPNVAVTHLQGDIWVRQNGTIWVAQPQLQQGSTRSTFMENPKDYSNYDQLVGEIAKKVATADLDSKVSKMETTINQQSNRIDFKAETENVYSKTDADGRFGSKAMVERHESSITLMSNQINSTVKKGDIISSINQTAEEIQIDVSKLSINADTVVKWLTTQGIDANVIKISGDVVTIDKSGITVRMANFLYEDGFWKKYSVMPKKNLIADHMFSSISCYLPTNNMRRIMHSPEWKITGEPYIEDNYTNFGYEQMINAMRINAQHWIRYTLYSGVKRGKKYTLSAHFRAATLNGNITSDYPRLRVITGRYTPDGRPVEEKRFEQVYDKPDEKTGKIVRYSNTFTVPDGFPDVGGFCYFDIYGAGDYGSNMAVCVSGVQLVEGDLPAVYNWDTTIDNIASGYTPVQSLSIGNRDTFLGYGVTSPEFRISTNADVQFNRKISTYGVNVGGQPFGSYGSIFYANGASGWSFYTMGVDGNWKT